ncbi:TPA: hypothetical protein N0F65_004535 [Lagenidium giganteum]|uniref:Uncharacterized protein n=1 Tax=Lagenidium giganteum TaxID=4803 RepID=A0AAV2YSZ2_9STRA|nr:TPA: hypothetical protein N0F65_004535 [Lagenidium giganteum]
MNNGLHHVATASFFPTTTELASGLQWFREHPVLAAAAATAVSVITYWSATEASTLVEDEEGSKDTGSRSSSRKLHAQCEGKLTAAVSWCDEHGGSLTQVFEELRVDDELDANRRARRRSLGDQDDDSRHGGEPGSKYGSTTDTTLSASPTASEMAARSQQAAARPEMEPPLLARVKDEPVTPTELDLQTESPQWGWYVAITPPQDHVHPHLPRAVAPPVGRAAATGHMAGPSLMRTPVSSLRRSTSGRIP